MFPPVIISLWLSLLSSSPSLFQDNFPCIFLDDFPITTLEDDNWLRDNEMKISILSFLGTPYSHFQKKRDPVDELLNTYLAAQIIGLTFKYRV